MRSVHPYRLLLLVCISFSSTVGLAAGSAIAAAPVKAGGKDPPPTLEHASEAARSARKALVVEVGASWCGPCKLLESQVLPHPSVQQALRGVVFVHYDAEVGPGRAAARTLGIRGYPTIIARAQDGTEIDRIQGVPGVSEMTRWLGRVAAESEATLVLEARAQQPGADGRTLLTLAQRYKKRGDGALAQRTLERALQAASGKDRPKDDAVASQADFQLRLFKLQAVLREEPRKAMTAHLMHFSAGPSADTAFFALARLGPADADARAALGQYIDAHTGAGQETALNLAIYECLRAAAYDEAERGARALLATAPRNPLYLDTLAEVRHLRGDQKGALQLSVEALAVLGEKDGRKDDKKGGEGDHTAEELRAELLHNQERFRRPGRELPPDLQRETDDPFPWESF